MQANIIASNNEEAIRILISDFERKIKSLENNKNIEKYKRAMESKQLEALADEKRRLNDRIFRIN